MKNYEATEQAYKNGYEKGYADGKKDSVEVVHGRWVEDTATDMIACTECGHAWNIIGNCTETFNYCPNCGAKMDG